MVWQLLVPALLQSALAAGNVAPSPPSVDEVTARLDDLYRSKASVARLEIQVTSARVSRTLRLRAWTRGEDRSLVVIEAPPREAGIATLRVGDNLWNFLPKVGRTLRVPPSLMLSSWMGTDFTNDDLVKESSYRRDFDSTVSHRSDSPPGWWVVSTVKPKVVGRWSRIEMLLSDDELLPMEMRHFDRKGRLARTLSFEDVQRMGGRRIPARMSLVPADSPDQRTVLRYLEVEFDAQVPEDTFSLSRLEQTR